MTKDAYLKFLGQLLREHYNSIKDTGVTSSDSQEFINGYLTAARTLNAIYQKDLKDYIERIHFEIFHMTIDERRKVGNLQSEISEADLDIPAYKRKGIKLKF
jgi:regulator of sigma D